MNESKVIQIIRNKEWERLIQVATFEMNIKQLDLTKWS